MLFRNYICFQCFIMPYKGSISNISSPTPYHYCSNIYSFVILCVLLLRLAIFLKMPHDFRSYIVLAIERTTMLDWSHVNDISRKYDYSSLPLIILFWKWFFHFKCLFHCWRVKNQKDSRHWDANIRFDIMYYNILFDLLLNAREKSYIVRRLHFLLND